MHAGYEPLTNKTLTVLYLRKTSLGLPQTLANLLNMGTSTDNCGRGNGASLTCVTLINKRETGCNRDSAITVYSSFFLVSCLRDLLTCNPLPPKPGSDPLLSQNSEVKGFYSTFVILNKSS